MSFREQSAWGMGLLSLIAGLWYLSVLLTVPEGLGAGGRIGPIITYVLAMIVGSVVIQSVLAIRAPREAAAAADEREQPIIQRAGHWSGVVLSAIAVIGALDYTAYGTGDRLFAWIMGGLILSQVVEYGLQIILFRHGQ